MTVDRVRRARELLPMLRIEVAAPCDVPWDSMPGDEARRHCGQCKKTVHDLTAMSSDEVSAFLISAIAFGAFTALSLLGVDVGHGRSHLHASTSRADEVVTPDLPGFLTVAPENAAVIVDGRTGRNQTQDVTLAAGEMRTISMSPPRPHVMMGMRIGTRSAPYID